MGNCKEARMRRMTENAALLSRGGVFLSFLITVTKYPRRSDFRLFAYFVLQSWKG